MKKVLIVDEERISTKGLLYLFESRFEHVFTCVKRTCSDGLFELEKGKYDLVILDMMLPLGNWPIERERSDNLYGIDLLAEITSKYKNVPVICYTVLDNEYIRQQIYNLKGYYFSKNSGDSRSELVSLIKTILKLV